MPPAEKMSVFISWEMARTIRESVEAGGYASASEALEDAVRVWRRERDEQAGRLELIKDRIRRSIDDPRPSLSLEQVRLRLAATHADALGAEGRETS